jgi:hypothetical protein
LRIGSPKRFCLRVVTFFALRRSKRRETTQ